LFTSEEDNIAEEKLHQLQEELSRAQADRVQAQSKYESASKASLESLPEVLDDKTLGEIQVKLTDLRRQLAELSSALTPEHPSVIKVQAQITALEGAMESKRKDFLERIQNEFRAAERRENLLETNYTAQVELVTEQADKVAHYNNLKRDVDTQRELYESMLHSVQEAGVSSALRASNIRVVDPAFPPTRRYKPTYAISLGLGLLAGLLFGMGFAVMRQRADRSFQAPGEAGLSLGVPELGVIPSTGAERNRLFAYYGDSGNGTKAIQPGNGETGHRNVLTILGLANRERALQAPDRGVPVRVELIASRRGSSVLADSFRATLTSILFSGENGNRPRVIVVTSASPGEGKTTVASNLALALADAGSPVLLVDGDLRKGRLHDIFQVSNDWGFSDVLAGNDPPPGHTGTYLQTHYPRLSLLPAGATPPSITGLLHSPRTLDFLSRVRKEFHTVIVDTPPMLNMADARVLGKLADGVILVLRSGQTTRESAAAAAQRLTADRTRVLGAVLNEWDPQKSSRASYAYRYA
jgi:capsular exopolysaccharide synthesis family protein